MKPKNKKKKKNKFNWLINLMLLLLLLVGVALIFNNQIKYFLMGWNTDKYSISKYSPDDLAANNQLKTTFDFGGVEAVSTEEVLRNQLKNQVLPVIGAVAIPELEVNLPIFKGLSNIVLLYGAGTMKEEQKMGEGNYALASHRVNDPRLLFSPLQRAEVGMQINITDLKKVYVYKATEVERVTPDHVELIDDVPGKKMISLVTCNDPGAIKRVVVRGVLEDEYEVNEAPKKVLESFKLKLNQGDW
ncbi:MAG: class A sortase [Lactobacillales bacterium]|jgi:sortase A|nr:class A sortase [Lactobacillales bacterium]